MVRKKSLILFVIFALFSYLQAGEKASLKVFISVDMELTLRIFIAGLSPVNSDAVGI